MKKKKKKKNGLKFVLYTPTLQNILREKKMFATFSYKVQDLNIYLFQMLEITMIFMCIPFRRFENNIFFYVKILSCS